MSEDVSSDGATRQEKLIKLVWPEGIPVRDLVVLEAVPAASRDRLLDRLEAVWRAERGEPLGPLAELAGLKRAGFYNLRTAWRCNSLAGLVPHDTRSGRRVDADDDDPLRKQAVKLLREKPLCRNVDVAKSILAENPKLVPKDATPHYALTVLQRLQRLVREERRSLSADPTFVGAVYGRALVLDLTAVQILIEAAAERSLAAAATADRSLAVAAILLETASGLILGSALGLIGAGSSLQIDSLMSGLSFLEREQADLPVVGNEMPRLGWMVPASLDADRLSKAVAPYVGDLTIGRAGGFSFGQQVVQVVGPRIGRTALIPRRTLSADVDIDEYLSRRIFPIVTLNEARAIWNREIERHNADRIIALKKAGVVGGGVPDGRLAAVIRAMLAALHSA